MPDFEQVKVVVYDSKGRQILSQVTPGGALILETGDWQSGMYSVVLTSGNAIETKKIIVAH